LQRFIRQSPALKGTPIRFLTKGERMSENFSLSLSKDHDHSENCGCVVTMEGISAVTAGFKITAQPGPLSQQYQDIISRAQPWNPHKDMRLEALKEENFIRNALPSKGLLQLIPCPLENPVPSWPESVVPSQPLRKVKNLLRQSDLMYFQWMLGESRYMPVEEVERNVWSDVAPSDTPLVYLCLRQVSAYRWACGKTNNRPHWVPAMADLYPFKLGKAVLHMARPDLGDRPKGAIKYLEEAITHLYRMMGLDMSKKYVVPFSMANLKTAYYGSSNGVQEGERSNFEWGPCNVKVTPCGKKIDTLEHDLDALLDFIRTGKEPPVYWTASPKSENAFEWIKQMNDDAWEALRQKLRLFIIPSGIFVMMERVVSVFRQLRERGRVIRIGHRWPHGGADTLAECLGIDMTNEFAKILVEGDVSKFDQSVYEAFVEAYFSTMLIHMDMSSPDYELFSAIVKFLLKNILVRVTRLFGSMWATIRGQVPSGCYNTSHMDSWVMALYIILFCIFQINSAPPEDRAVLEEHFLDSIKAIVYGDDFLYNKGTGKIAEYFSGQLFKEFMKKYLEVEIRDLFDGISFLSTVKDGRIVERGATFLRHQLILNPYRDDPRYPCQPRYLPYRESREYMIRAIHSRESRPRDEIDVLLSVKGLAYATYASNLDAYRRLAYLYKVIASSFASQVEFQKVLESRVSVMNIKAYRMMGVGMEQLVGEFPTWETLILKNTVDPAYQDISLPGRNYSVDNLEECDMADIEFW